MILMTYTEDKIQNIQKQNKMIKDHWSMIMTDEEDESQRYLGFNPDIKRGTLFEKCRYVFLFLYLIGNFSKSER